MKKRSVHRDVTLPAHHHAAKISDPREGPLDLPPPFIPPQLPSILQWRSLAVGAMRTDQGDASISQALAQRVRVTGFAIDEPCRALAGATPALPGHGNRLQRRLDQRHFGGGRRVQEVVQGVGWDHPKAWGSGSKGALFSHCASVHSRAAQNAR
jgi:hypothetical protein